MRSVFAAFGIPNVVRSNNGGCSDSITSRKFMDEVGCTLATSSPRYPCSNSMAESAVKTIKMLRKKCEGKEVAL